MEKFKIINDPIYGAVEIPDEFLFEIIAHFYFQRLRRISQTGFLDIVFPGATHTRFHHAIGAMSLMNKALSTLKSKGVKISPEEKQAALLAILLHDVGHGPFSHALEKMFIQNIHHERISLLLMQMLNQEFNGKLSLAIEMFQGKYHRNFFNQLISSQLDVDRLDYLKRDSFYTGVLEGGINSDRIISIMNVENDQLIIEEKAVASVEVFLMARMSMYWQVYYHKTAVLVEYLLLKIVSRAKNLIAQGSYLPVSENLDHFLYQKYNVNIDVADMQRFIQLDDSDLYQAIKQWQNHPDLELSYLCKAIIQRKLPSVKVSSQPFELHFIQEKADEVKQKFKNETMSHWVESISKTFTPYDLEKNPIVLLDKNGNRKLFQDSENRMLSNDFFSKKKKYFLIIPQWSL